MTWVSVLMNCLSRNSALEFQAKAVLLIYGLYWLFTASNHLRVKNTVTLNSDVYLCYNSLQWYQLWLRHILISHGYSPGKADCKWTDCLTEVITTKEIVQSKLNIVSDTWTGNQNNSSFFLKVLLLTTLLVYPV